MTRAPMKNSKQRIEVVTIRVGSAARKISYNPQLPCVRLTLVEEQKDQEDVHGGQEHRAVERNLRD